MTQANFDKSIYRTFPARAGSCLVRRVFISDLFEVEASSAQDLNDPLMFLHIEAKPAAIHRWTRFCIVAVTK